MTDDRRQAVRRVFMEVANLPSEERDAVLALACGDDRALRAEVEALLRAESEAGEFMANPTNDALSTHDANATVVKPPREQVGERIGRYKLLEQIGEGGFGTVWAAEQREPVKRRVALKIIKLGMDTQQVIARFEAERQALAMMDHPNIAKVLDAGAHRDRPTVLRDGTGQGRSDPRLLRYGNTRHEGAARSLHEGLPRDPARAPEGHHPPRHQAVERDDHAARWRAGAQGHRLRHRQGDEPGVDEQDDLHASTSR